MLLEARREGCFSDVHVLKLDERPSGQFQGRWFGEGLDIHLLEGRHWKFHKSGFLTSEFVLHEGEHKDQVLARAQPAGMFTSKWNMQLSVGPAQLVPAGWFKSGWLIKQDEMELGKVEPLGACQSGWKAETSSSLNEMDLLVAGLVFQIVAMRRQRAAAAASASGS